MEAPFRYVRYVGVPSLVFGVGVVGYVLYRSTGSLRADLLDPVSILAIAVALSSLALGILLLLLLLRVGPNAVYEEGIDMGNVPRYWEVLAGRTFHSWDEFSRYRIELIGPPAHRLKRITLYWRKGRGRIVFTNAYLSAEFVDALGQFLATSKVLPLEQEAAETPAA